MSQTRALFASIGASVSLVAAAALSLLAVSAVFAFGGWSDPVVDSVKRQPIVLGAVGDAATSQRVVPVRLAEARPRAAAQRAHRPRRHRRAASPPRPVAHVAPQVAVASRPAVAPAVDPTPVATAPPPPPPSRAPSVGQRVRSAGDGLSATVASAGGALADATQPLLPPVSSALQKITNLLVEVLRDAGKSVGALLDAVLPPPK